jgi:hypothetical protein
MRDAAGMRAGEMKASVFACQARGLSCRIRCASCIRCMRAGSPEAADPPATRASEFFHTDTAIDSGMNIGESRFMQDGIFLPSVRLMAIKVIGNGYSLAPDLYSYSIV